MPGSVNFSDRPWFKQAIAPDAPSVVVSQLLVSRITGKPTVVVAAPGLPGTRADGAQPAGRAESVVSVSLNLNWMAEITARLHTPEGGVILVVDPRDGAILARAPAGADWVGRRFLDHPISIAARRQSEGVLQVDGFDGQPRIFGFARLPGDLETNAVVLVGIPRSVVLSAATSHLLQGLAVTALMVLLGTIVAATSGAFMLTRPLRNLGDLARRLSQGELSARVALPGLVIDEFRHLGAALNEAASRIQERDVQLAELASRDGLTGLLNRRAFDQCLMREWHRAERDRASLAVAMIDIDRFKLLNDRYGHGPGDDCLKHVAAALGAALRKPSDIVARYGGEEIVLIMPGTNAAEAKIVADRLVDVVRDLAIPNVDAEGGVVTISIGVAATSGAYPRSSADNLLKAADAALYRAKAQGRNRALIGEGGAGETARAEYA